MLVKLKATGEYYRCREFEDDAQTLLILTNNKNSNGSLPLLTFIVPRNEVWVVVSGTICLYKSVIIVTSGRLISGVHLPEYQLGPIDPEKYNIGVR